jgi:hypothetical protein
MLGDTTLPSVAGLCLEPIDEVDHVVEATAGTVADAASRDGDGQMGLASAGTANQNDIALLCDEAGASEIIDKGLVDRRSIELEVVDVLGEWKLGNRQLVLD